MNALEFFLSSRGGMGRWAGWLVLFLAGLPVWAGTPAVNVAAHYYPWYTTGRWNYQECNGGTLRSQLSPAQHPKLGNYDSSDPNVINHHLQWCSEYNIRTLILEFYGSGSGADLVCRNDLFTNPHAGDVQFTVLYDWAIRLGSFNVTAAALNTVSNDFRFLSEFYFTRPNWLRSPDGRPVVLIYVTRALTGDLDGLVRTLRAAVAAEHQTVYLVGDEFFYVDSPDTTRIRRWDAIFGYDVYAGRGGYWGDTGNAAFFQRQTTAFRSAANSVGATFFPSIAPGFNDRAVRRTCANNAAAARRLTARGGPASLFESSFDFAVKTLDPVFPMVCVTSFNEWHEDTMIEPTAGTGTTTTNDLSATRTTYTQGLEYDDYGFGFLEFLRDRTVAVSGHATSFGHALPNARVVARVQNGAAVELRTDSFGLYKLLRADASPGAAVGVQLDDPTQGFSGSMAVVVGSAATVTNIDLVTAPPPVLTATASNGAVHLSFPALSGLHYQLRSSTNLVTWLDDGVALAGTNGVFGLDRPIAATPQFYRVIQSP
jgi:glycoprotein endo-alpha-1,2-mannosidase